MRSKETYGCLLLLLVAAWVTYYHRGTGTIFPKSYIPKSEDPWATSRSHSYQQVLENMSESAASNSSDKNNRQTSLTPSTVSSSKIISNMSQSIMKKRDASCVVYTRVDKCGSTYVNEIINTHGHYIKSSDRAVAKTEQVYDKLFDDINGRKKFMEWLLTKDINKHELFANHALFFDFDELDEPRWPLYFSIVRNPLERFISHFYFVKMRLRAPHYNNKYLYESLEDCLKNQTPLCDFSENRTLLIIGRKDKQPLVTGMIPYFCGYQPFCRHLYTDEGLKLAKSNIEKHFQFIGIMEEMDVFFEMLEKIIPAFHGITESRQKSDYANKKKNKTKKKMVSKELRDYITRKLEKEFDLYNFIKDRMCKQYGQLFPNRPALESCLL